MARGRREGVVIAGGGLAGSLAALALATRRPDVPVLIVEERPRFGGERFRFGFDAELDEEAQQLLEPLVEHRWPGFYVAFPGLNRNIRAPLFGFGPHAVHAAMMAALASKQHRLGTRIVAVREDALVLDGGETIKAHGAIDARGAANLSTLELLYETRLERVISLKAPHRLDRPLLVDATVEQSVGFSFVQAFPLDGLRMRIAKVNVSERAQVDEACAGRLDHYLALRGWKRAKVEDELALSRPLPIGGDFGAFWRLGGARVAKVGLRGGFLQPATGRSVADAARVALLLASQTDFSGAALHDLFEEQARQLWRRREFQRGINAAMAAARPEERRAIAERLYRLDPGLIVRFHADRLGLLERARVHRTLRG